MLANDGRVGVGIRRVAVGTGVEVAVGAGVVGAAVGVAVGAAVAVSTGVGAGSGASPAQASKSSRTVRGTRSVARMAAIADTSQRSVIGTCNSNQDPMRSAGRHEGRAFHLACIRYHASGMPQGRSQPKVRLLLQDVPYHSHRLSYS